jgi:hypothetical protein
MTMVVMFVMLIFNIIMRAENFLDLLFVLLNSRHMSMIHTLLSINKGSDKHAKSGDHWQHKKQNFI